MSSIFPFLHTIPVQVTPILKYLFEVVGLHLMSCSRYIGDSKTAELPQIVPSVLKWSIRFQEVPKFAGIWNLSFLAEYRA